MEQLHLQSDDWKSYLLEEDLSVKSTNHNRFGELKWAILHGQKERAEFLLQENTPVDNPCEYDSNFRSPLHSAVYLGDVEVVKKLLARGASSNVLNQNNETCLMLAAKFEKFTIVDLLLSDKKLSNCANKENLTHLHIACMRNRVDVVKKLMENELDINASVSSASVRWAGYTLLHFAVQFQCLETVDFLLSVGADVTTRNSNQLTALHMADMTRNERMIDKILMAHKTVAQNPTNSEGLSHFHIACTRNNPEIVECFIKNGVALDARVRKNSLNWPKFTAIDFAIYYDCVDNVKLLMQEGGREIFPSLVTYKSDSRVRNAHLTGNVELINEFLLRDEDSIRKKVTAIEKPPLLHQACIDNDINTVRELLRETVEEINAPMWQGNTPLHLAVDHENDGIISCLLLQGADFNFQNANGKSPLHLAFERHNRRIVKSFLGFLDRITKNPIDNDGFSHLHIACIENEVEAVERFIELGVDLSTPVNFDAVFWPGYTPFHFAAKFGSGEVARILLKNGASFLTYDKYGSSAFDAAVSVSQDLGGRDGVFGVMKAILLSHAEKKVATFNDRGFSLLHLLCCEVPCDTEAMSKFINEHPDEINKCVHSLNLPWDGYSPLHFAASWGGSVPCNLLVERGADVFSQLPNGDTPCHLSLYVSEVRVSPSNFNRMQHNPFGTSGCSLFHMACYAENIEWMEYFLNHGIDPNLYTTIGCYEFHHSTALHMAMKFGNRSRTSVVTLLLEKGANACARDYRQNTPLHYVVGSVEPEIIDLLIKHGAQVDARNAFLETPLKMVCEDDSDDDSLNRLLQLLLNHGADINLVDERGTTPLSADTWIIRNFDAFPSSIEVLMKHVIKLRSIGAFISESNDEAYASLWSLISDQSKFNLLLFEGYCKAELNRLKEVRTDGYTTLQAILFKDLNGLSVISQNNVFKQMIASNDLQTKFPIFASMLELQFKKGQERNRLLAESHKALNSLTKISLPRECFERVSRPFTNRDLKNIILSWN